MIEPDHQRRSDLELIHRIMELSGASFDDVFYAAFIPDTEAGYQAECRIIDGIVKRAAARKT
jgi:hypothetical protein